MIFIIIILIIIGIITFIIQTEIDDRRSLSKLLIKIKQFFCKHTYYNFPYSLLVFKCNKCNEIKILSADESKELNNKIKQFLKERNDHSEMTTMDKNIVDKTIAGLEKEIEEQRKLMSNAFDSGNVHLIFKIEELEEEIRALQNHILHNHM